MKIIKNGILYSAECCTAKATTGNSEAQ